MLPPTFAFSQSSLQAFQDCARRFWLAYVEQLPWPAIEAAPVQDFEQFMRLGAAFHRLVERSEISMDTEKIARSLTPPLSQWFEAYRLHRPGDLPTDFVEVERVLTIPFTSARNGQEYRLAAKYDLIAASAHNEVVIVDWKTSRRRTDPSVLRNRLQSQVYPFVLVEASPFLPWGALEPEQVEMRYWFSAAPAQPVTFTYDRRQHESNREQLQRLLDSLLTGVEQADFPMVLDTEINRRRFCNFCVYRSRCRRGQSAGDLDEVDDLDDFFVIDPEAALEFTLDEVEELAF